MKPNARTSFEYERVSTDDFLPGIIEEIQRDPQRATGFKDKNGQPVVKDCIRFKFKLDGYSFPHYSSWMSFGYGEKFRLFDKYIRSLVDGAQPDMDLDIERLKGLAVKILWSNNGDFQNVETIRPLTAKIDPTIPF